MYVINRPVPVPLESLASYLERVRVANYYDEAAWYQELLPARLGTNVALLSNPQLLEQLAGLLQQPVAQLQQMTLHPLAQRYQAPNAPLPQGMVETPEGGRAWHPTSPSAWLVGRNQQPVCVRCLADHGASLLPWYLRHVTTCPVHHVLLMDKCPQCGTSIIGARDHCKGCGARRSDLEPTPWEEAEDQALTTLVWGALGLPHSGDPTTLPLSPTSPLTHIHPASLLLFLWKISGLVLDNERYQTLVAENEPITAQSSSTMSHRLRQQHLSNRHRVLQRSTRILLDWPATWEAVLEECVAADQGRSIHQCTPRRLLEWFGDTSWSWLHDSWAAFLQAHLVELPGLERWLRVCRERQQEQPEDSWTIFSRREAAKVLDMSIRTLLQRFDHTSFNITRRGGRGVTQYIDAEGVRQLQAAQAREQTLAATAAQCGLSEPLVVALVSANLLPALRQPRREQEVVWTFQGDTVASHLQTWLGALPIEPVPPEATGPWLGLVAVLQRLGKAGMRFPDVVRAVWNGELPAIRIDERHRFDIVRCSAIEVTQFLKRLRAMVERPSCSVSEVCERLQCKPSTLRQVMAAGLLVPIEEPAPHSLTAPRFAAADVAAFFDRYITVDEAAIILGVTRLTVQFWARQDRITPVMGGHIDGTRRYRFDRYLLEQWRRERLTSGETQELLGISKATLSRWVRQRKLTPLEDMGGVHRWFARAEIEALRADTPS